MPKKEGQDKEYNVDLNKGVVYMHKELKSKSLSCANAASLRGICSISW